MLAGRSTTSPAAIWFDEIRVEPANLHISSRASPLRVVELARAFARERDDDETPHRRAHDERRHGDATVERAPHGHRAIDLDLRLTRLEILRGLLHDHPIHLRVPILRREHERRDDERGLREHELDERAARTAAAHHRRRRENEHREAQHEIARGERKRARALDVHRGDDAVARGRDGLRVFVAREIVRAIVEWRTAVNLDRAPPRHRPARAEPRTNQQREHQVPRPSRGASHGLGRVDHAGEIARRLFPSCVKNGSFARDMPNAKYATVA